MVLFIILAVGTVLLTVGSALHEEAAEDDQTHYESLGVKRMAKSSEIEVAYAQLVEQKVERLSEDKMSLVEEAYKVLSSPQSRRTYDRTTPATLNELYYKQIEYLTSDNYRSKVMEEDAGVPWLIEIHGASHRPPRAGTIHIPPNWGRLLTKASKVLQGYVKLGRINVDAESELAQQLDLGSTRDLPRVIAVKGGVIVPYDKEPRILKMCDFIGDQISDAAVDQLTYNNYQEWRNGDPRVKVVLFRKHFTRMVMVFREAAQAFGKESTMFQFGEIDVRTRGAVNLWRRHGMRRMPLVAVLRSDDKNPALLGGSFSRKMLDNFLLSNRLPVEFPRLSSENFEEVCMHGDSRYCVILAADPRYVSHNQVNSSMGVFLQASKMVAKHPTLSQVGAKFCWADKVGEYINTTEVWKSIFVPFGITPEVYSIHLFITDNHRRSYKDFGGNLFKVTDWADKDEEISEFIDEFVGSKLKTVSIPSPLFQAPPPPPYTQEEKSKLFITVVVCGVVLAVLGWSFVTFKQEQAIKEEMVASGQIKRRKEKRDGEYDIDN